MSIRSSIILAGSVVAFVWAATWLAVVLAARETGQDRTRVRVVASIYPWSFLIHQVGGPDVDVYTLTPAGAEPHDYEPTPRDVARVAEADLFVYGGQGIDAWVSRILANLRGANSRAIKTISFSDGGETGGGTESMHPWLDPVYFYAQVDRIRQMLSEIRPNAADKFQARAANLKSMLSDLNQGYENGLAACEKLTIITSHAAFDALVDRYGLRQIGIAGLSPESEPSAARLREITETVRRTGVSTIFFERLLSPRLAETIAHETEGTVAVLDPIEGNTLDGVPDEEAYLRLMRANLSALRRALGCK